MSSNGWQYMVLDVKKLKLEIRLVYSFLLKSTL